MKVLRNIFMYPGLFFLALHTFSLFSGIKHFTFRFSSSKFTYEDNIDGIYFGLTLIVIAIILDIAENRSKAQICNKEIKPKDKVDDLIDFYEELN